MGVSVGVKIVRSLCCEVNIQQLGLGLRVQKQPREAAQTTRKDIVATSCTLIKE
jgi:hypothetical protein